MTKKPRCFIAMAFGCVDTDKLYDDTITLVLKQNGVYPVIINRRQDNRDINYQIIEQIENCDFCIADLTYARPSVYFEAGYAQRQVEVIYTVREDHLKRGQPDNERVHFDLQMKPLIIWKTPDDNKFKQNLDKRLKSTVLKDFARKVNKDETLKRERETFRSLPLNKRLELIRRIGINHFRRMGFKNWWLESLRQSDPSYNKYFKNPGHLANRNAMFLTSRRTKETIQFVSIKALESVTLNFLKQINFVYGESSIIHFPYPQKFEKEVVKLKRQDEYHIFLSLKKTPETRVMLAMPYLSKDNSRNCYFVETKYEIKQWPKDEEISINRKVYFYFFSNITSESQLKKDMGKFIKNIQCVEE